MVTDEELDDGMGGDDKAAAIDVNGGGPCLLRPVDIRKLEKGKVFKDDGTMLLDTGRGGSNDDSDDDDSDDDDDDGQSIRIQTGDLRLTVRWRQRDGNGHPGLGVAYLCRRVDCDPPAVKDSTPLPFRNQREHFDAQLRYLRAGNF